MWPNTRSQPHSAAGEPQTGRPPSKNKGWGGGGERKMPKERPNTIRKKLMLASQTIGDMLFVPQCVEGHFSRRVRSIELVE